MINIKKQYGNDNFWVEGSEGVTYNLSLYIDVQPELVEIKLFETSTPSNIRMWHKIPLETFHELRGMYGQSVWTIPYKNTYTDTAEGPTPLIVPSYMLIDMFAGSYFPRGARTADLQEYEHSICFIFFPEATSNYTECTFIIKTPSGDLEYDLVGPENPQYSGTIFQYKECLAPITLSSVNQTIAPDGTATVNVTSSPFIKEVYLEQVYGTTNKLRVALTNGQGKFNVYATDMAAGESVRVKAGHKKFLGLTDITIPVV